MGRLFDALTDTDKRMAEYYINRCSGETMSASLEHILRFWDKEKEPIFDMFGGKLILEKEIHFERSQEQIVYLIEGRLLQGQISPPIQIIQQIRHESPPYPIIVIL